MTQTWTGSHLVTFVAYDTKLDPDGARNRIAIDLSILIDIKPPVSEEDPITAFIKESPVMIG